MLDLLIISENLKRTSRIKRLIYRFKPDNFKIIVSQTQIKNPPFWLDSKLFSFTEYINLIKLEEKKQLSASLELIQKIRRHSIGSSSFDEVVSLKGLALWELASPLLLLYYLGPLVKNIEVIRYILDTEKPKKLILIWSDDMFLKVALAFAKKKDLEFHYFALNRGLLNRLKRLLKPVLQPFLRALIIHLKIIKVKVKTILKKEITEEKGKKKIFFLNTSPAQLKSILPIIRRILKKDSQKRIIISVLSKTYRSLRILEKEAIAFKIAEDYLDTKIFKLVKEDLVLFQRVWRLINEHNDSLKDIPYRELPIWEFIKPLFNYLLFSPFVTLGEDLEAVSIILEKEKPDLIVYTDEIDIFSRILLLLAKRKKIPLLRIQYGEVGPYAADWRYCLADKTAVFGEGIKEILRNAGIDLERIVVTGQPRFDVSLNSKDSKTEILRRHKLPIEKKIVLFASNYHFGKDIAGTFGSFLTPQEHTIWLREVYSALRKVPDVQSIVKPHHNPYDPIQVHRNILRQLRANKNIKLFSPHSNITELIKICDLLISWDSTVVSEAIVFGKPIVIVNLTGRPDQLPFVEQGVALGAYRKEDILPSIKMVLEDERVQNKLKEAQAQFIKDYLYQLDGKASERIADLIRQMCRE